MLIVKCPKCGHSQKTQPRNVMKAVKRCVYCGHSFKIHSGAENTRILSGI